ncbi:STAS domain-containing protein [Amycolatopsis regifaucium]|uniref:Anti-sigma factor antagonist n=1 Tax=Amycolatopsis regifaucium TaxID=546365 RepID=A0A154MAA7_9PSEU|nr:STAS domain-containing protein [Amycolatopsis regifaucium]KZB81492.1 anti-anti-sigma factor [Amycolatopsis regifaucium]OKA06938.1 anti-anti-sigma factor [Amycolatopsis regifaucium]SFH30007.1 anti-sigma B factor antagonist [Amycolatopsis regifaucium]
MAFDTEAAQPTPLAMTATEHPHDAITIEVAGDVDAATSPRLRARLRDLVESRPSAVVVDMTAVGFCDSSGLSVLVQLNRYCTESGIALSIRPSKVVRRAIELTGLLATLTMAD